MSPPAVSPNHSRSSNVLTKSSPILQTRTNMAMTLPRTPVIDSNTAPLSGCSAELHLAHDDCWRRVRGILVALISLDNPFCLLCVLFSILQDKFRKHQWPVPHVASHPGLPDAERSRLHPGTHGWVVVHSHSCQRVKPELDLFPSCSPQQIHSLWKWTYPHRCRRDSSLLPSLFF